MPPKARRTFLKWSTLGVASLAACGDDARGAEGDDTEAGSRGETESGSGSGESSASSSEDTGETGATECLPTPNQTAGPYPQAGLERSNLDLYGHEGRAFAVSGLVLDGDCNPVADAQVLLWHATPSAPGVMPTTLEADPAYTSAIYDHSNQAGATTPDGQTVPTGEQMYYGWVITDAEGRYRFESLRPGWYLNGAVYRASHLHVRVFVDGEVRLTTQLYFPDDPFNDDDPIYVAACGDGGCSLDFDDPMAPSEGRFDLHIQG